MANVYPLTRTTRRVIPLSWQWQDSQGRHNNGVVTATTIDQVSLGASSKNWRKVISLGGNAGSILSGTRQKYSGMCGGGLSVTTAVTPPLVTVFSGAAQGVSAKPSPSSASQADADNKARSKLLSSYINATNSWRGGNFLAEVGETIHMLRHPIVSLFGHTEHFVQGVHKLRGIKSPSEYRKKLGNIWLAYSFGWKPLFEDIRDANKALAKLAADPPHDSFPISGRGHSDGILAHSIFEWGGPPGMVGDYNAETYLLSKSDVRYYGAIIGKPASLSTVADTFGVSPYDVVPAVWEAVPWSFLVDYFVNVQEVLDSMRYCGASLGWLMCGVRNITKKTTFLTGLHAPLPANTFESVSVSPEVWTITDVTRVPVNSLPYPSFHFKMPGIGSLKWVNISALISQISASKPKYL